LICSREGPEELIGILLLRLCYVIGGMNFLEIGSADLVSSVTLRLVESSIRRSDQAGLIALVVWRTAGSATDTHGHAAVLVALVSNAALLNNTYW
jgi:hypothetical protein